MQHWRVRKRLTQYILPKEGEARAWACNDLFLIIWDQDIIKTIRINCVLKSNDTKYLENVFFRIFYPMLHLPRGYVTVPGRRNETLPVLIISKLFMRVVKAHARWRWRA